MISTTYLLSHYTYDISTANRIHITITIITALINPNLPMSSAIAVSFSYNGVAIFIYN